MLDNNWKTWVVLVIAFVGASVELLKHLPSSHAPQWEKENLHYGMEGKPYSIHELPKKLRAPSRPAVAHVSGDTQVLAAALKSYKASTAQTQTEIAHKVAPKKAAKAVKKKKKGDDEYETVIDPVTGKKFAAKRKKKPKKKTSPRKKKSPRPSRKNPAKPRMTKMNPPMRKPSPRPSPNRPAPVKFLCRLKRPMPIRLCHSRTGRKNFSRVPI